MREERQTVLHLIKNMDMVFMSHCCTSDLQDCHDLHDHHKLHNHRNLHDHHNVHDHHDLHDCRNLHIHLMLRDLHELHSLQGLLRHLREHRYHSSSYFCNNIPFHHTQDHRTCSTAGCRGVHSIHNGGSMNQAHSHSIHPLCKLGDSVRSWLLPLTITSHHGYDLLLHNSLL